MFAAADAMLAGTEICKSRLFVLLASLHDASMLEDACLEADQCRQQACVNRFGRCVIEQPKCWQCW
jgi:hypothetical protein